ncbi:unnamed protein product [Owenia fusiformis]|uniref:E3 ubiquitin-protein ligase n=1 Tax=Owenia fusiformis TaxID=6347 RepID=A0A8S4PEC9_OWEFU|nr:unnamed protein product [Owenia fusiformis]
MASPVNSIQEFNSETLVREWLECLSHGTLQQALKRHWRVFVPKVYFPSVEPDMGKEDRLSKRFLFRPIETFLCQGDPKTVFKELKEQNTPSQICGHVFKMGEPTYSCRDCGADPTCVLCIQCFQKSVHKGHRYKMSTSGGGGYCDCGDTEAWKSDPFCDTHRAVETPEERQDPIESLSADLRERATELFKCVLMYAVEMVTWSHPVDLPIGLEQDGSDRSFATVLFNDEVHTYEQVIQTLTRAIDCDQKAAVDFATVVDREGRSAVKVDKDFNVCEKVKNTIERNTSRHGGKPLKVEVMNSAVVAHQAFALKLLTWLRDDVISYSDGLRKIFCNIAMATASDEDQSLLETMLLNDTQLWKAVRRQSHQLFMSGVMLDQDVKKRFAILFTKHYPHLMGDFIKDDHDHSVCIVSETVQIYTVPTLARMLIAEHDLLSVIMDTFLHECESKKNAHGKFVFERNDRGASSQAVKRAQYMLYDFKYALTCKPQSPDEWSDNLRKHFLTGFQKLLQLLQCIQGMDSVVRQKGQHIEYEPEWDGAFNLQLKLEDNLAMMLQWCAADRKVLLDAYNAGIEILRQCNSEHDTKWETVSVGAHQVSCIKYDVSSQHVSIHLPVSRMVAGIFPLFHRYGIPLRGIQPQTCLSAVELIEPVVRCAVMISQTHAGMWRRNGYSLLNQIYFYHNVRCRTEMYDRDIVMLQAGAALIDSNEFLIHLMNKFAIIQWAKEEYDLPRQGGQQEDLVRQTVTLVEEFLHLLIIILCERYTPGIGEVGERDSVKREIIHQLCIESMAHSELEKSLPDDTNHETGIEEAVHDVANFNKPTSSAGKGVYELKEQRYEEYNPYFYHYSRAEQSKSEEAQRKRKKAANGDQALPPPVPPPFVPGLQPAINMLQCNVMLHIIRVVLQRTTVQRSRSWSEPQLEKVLFLVGLALHEENRAFERKDESFSFTEKALQGEPSILQLLESLVSHSNVEHEAQKDLLAWVLKKFHDVQSLRTKAKAGPVIASTSNSDDRMEKERKRKAQLAAKKRAKIMAQMSKMQKNFIKDNAELFEGAESDLRRVGSDMDISEAPKEFPVALGRKKCPLVVTGNNRVTCILCQEEQDVTATDKSMVLTAFIQQSTVLSKSRGKVVQNPETYDPLFMSSDVFWGTHIGSCGHTMHADCWQRYFDSIVAKVRRRPLRYRQHMTFDIRKQEFLCPLCETLSNIVVPLVPPLGQLANKTVQHVDLSIEDWLDAIQKTVRESIKEDKDKETEEESLMVVPCPLPTLAKMMSESVSKNFQALFDYVYSEDSDHFSDSTNEMLRKLSKDIYLLGLGLETEDDNVRVPVMTWRTCAFTIQVIEQSLREESKPLFGSLPSRQADCLQALVRFAGVSAQNIASDINKKLCVRLLAALVSGDSDKKFVATPGCVLDFDMFHYLVSVCLALPTLYVEDQRSLLGAIPTGGLNEQHVLQLVFTAHIVQILITTDFHIHDSMELEPDADSQALVDIYHRLRKQAGIEVSNVPSAWQLHQRVKHISVPFLRSAALFFHYLTGISSPVELQQENCLDEFDYLCRYLALPSSLAALFDPRNTLINTLVASWCSDDNLKTRISASSEKLTRYPLKVNQLIKLPKDYSDVINSASTFTCPKSDGEDSRAPTMCLVCGEMLCSQSYCCQIELDGMTVGAATAHAQSCGSGVGLFLRVRECQILLLAGKIKGSFHAPPYLDDYGETDQGLRRGNPLRLCPDRFKKLHKLWLSHGIPEEISRNLETNSQLLSIDWQHL